jgi:hypothetical protein
MIPPPAYLALAVWSISDRAAFKALSKKSGVSSATSNPRAVEVLRVWAAPGQPRQLTCHAANAYANEGLKIRQFLDAEFSRPTDNPIELK